MVTVTNGTLSDGSFSGEYAQGDTVTITADEALSGQQFKEWLVESGNITLSDSTSATTTFIMPAEEVSVKAAYEAITDANYQITKGADSIWTLGSSEGLAIVGNGEFSKFIGVKVDGSIQE